MVIDGGRARHEIIGRSMPRFQRFSEENCECTRMAKGYGETHEHVSSYVGTSALALLDLSNADRYEGSL